jgi:hypothetical protein
VPQCQPLPSSAQQDKEHVIAENAVLQAALLRTAALLAYYMSVVNPERLFKVANLHLPGNMGTWLFDSNVSVSLRLCLQCYHHLRIIDFGWLRAVRCVFLAAYFDAATAFICAGLQPRVASMHVH